MPWEEVAERRVGFCTDMNFGFHVNKKVFFMFS
jgi:hypothetical protein